MVRFQQGGAEGGSEWEARLVVGADGAFSAVRRQCLDDGKPDFAVSGCSCSRPLLGAPGVVSRSQPMIADVFDYSSRPTDPAKHD